MIGAVILAAGQSRRMGTQKLALPIRGQPLLLRVFNEISRSEVDQIVVVVSSATEQLAREVLPSSATLAVNPNVESEMLASVRCGVRGLPHGCESVLIAVGDQPGINSELVNSVIVAYRKSHRGIVVPSHGDKRGHPILIASKYFVEVLAHYDNVGLHGLLEAHPEDIEVIEAADAGILEDIDEPADYERAIASERPSERKYRGS